MQELYEKHRDGVLDNEEVWKALFDRDLAVLPDILGHEDEVRAALREADLTPDERAEVYAARDDASSSSDDEADWRSARAARKTQGRRA